MVWIPTLYPTTRKLHGNASLRRKGVHSEEHLKAASLWLNQDMHIFTPPPPSVTGWIVVASVELQLFAASACAGWARETMRMKLESDERGCWSGRGARFVWRSAGLVCRRRPPAASLLLCLHLVLWYRPVGAGPLSQLRVGAPLLCLAVTPAALCLVSETDGGDSVLDGTSDTKQWRQKTSV